MDTPPKRKPGRPKKLGKTEQVSVRFSSELLAKYDRVWNDYIIRIEKELPTANIQVGELSTIDLIKRINRADMLRLVFSWAFKKWDSFLLESDEGLEFFTERMILESLDKILEDKPPIGKFSQDEARFYLESLDKLSCHLKRIMSKDDPKNKE